MPILLLSGFADDVPLKELLSNVHLSASVNFDFLPCEYSCTKTANFKWLNYFSFFLEEQNPASMI